LELIKEKGVNFEFFEKFEHSEKSYFDDFDLLLSLFPRFQFSEGKKFEFSRQKLLDFNANLG